MFATGRGIGNVLPYVEELQLDTPIVTVNGSEVWTAPGILHSRTLLDTTLFLEMHAIALEYETWYWANAVNERFDKKNWTDQMESKQWLKFAYHCEDAERLQAICTRLELRNDALEISNSNLFNLEINAKGVNKVNGVRKVCALLGIEMSQVVAIGDGLNDDAMIREAGLGVAMGNAQDRIIQSADVVTGTNQEHGVASMIQQFILS